MSIIREQVINRGRHRLSEVEEIQTQGESLLSWSRKTESGVGAGGGVVLIEA